MGLIASAASASVHLPAKLSEGKQEKLAGAAVEPGRFINCTGRYYHSIWLFICITRVAVAVGETHQTLKTPTNHPKLRRHVTSCHT